MSKLSSQLGGSEEIGLKNQISQNLFHSKDNFNKAENENQKNINENKNNNSLGNAINPEFKNNTNQNINNINQKQNNEKNNSTYNKFTHLIGQKILNKSMRERQYIYNQSKSQYDLYSLGKIKYAKMHKDAYRPLHKIQEFTPKIKFCQCCNLPIETKGYIEKFSMFDKTDNFSECGIGISLYFLFFRYAIFCLFMVCILIAIPMIISNEHYTRGLNRLCNNYYDFVINKTKMPKNLTICNKFINHAKGSEFYDNETDWALRFSSDNLKSYRIVSNLTTEKFDNVNRVVLNYSTMDFCCIFTLFIINIFYIILIQTMSQSINLKNTSPSDYTLVITNLRQAMWFYIKKNKKNKEKNKNNENNENIFEDENIVDKEEFINYLKNDYLYDKKNPINEINLCYKLKEYKQFQKDYDKTKYKIFQVNYNPKQIKLNKKIGYQGTQKRYFSSKITPLNKINCLLFHNDGISLDSLNLHKKYLEDQIEELEQGNQTLSKINFAECIFAIFNTIKEKEKYYDKFPHNFLTLLYFYLKYIYYFLFSSCIDKNKVRRFQRKKKISVDHAPEPEDVIWENLEISFIERVKRGIIIYSITIFLLLFAFGLVLSLTYLQDYSNDHDWEGNTLIKYGVSLIITGVISGINSFFQFLLEIFTKYEKHISMTNYYLSFSIKLTWFTFLTSAIVPMASNYVQNSWGDNQILVHNMLMLFLVNSFVTPILWTCNIDLIIKKIQIWIIESRINPDLHHYKTQKELNDLYELPDMEISYKYSYIMKTLLMAFFYIPIFPLGVLISFIGLIVGYFLELFNFTHLYKKPEMLNEKMCKFYVDYFIVNLFVFAIGDYIFMSENFENGKWSLANIILFGILIIMPYPKLFECNFIGVKESEINNKTLNHYYFSFYNDYQRQNPLTKREGLITYINKLFENKKISKKVYDYANKNIENINIMEIYYHLSQTKIIKDNELPSLNQLIQNKTNNFEKMRTRTNKSQTSKEEINDEKNDNDYNCDNQFMKVFTKCINNGNEVKETDIKLEKNENENNVNIINNDSYKFDANTNLGRENENKVNNLNNNNSGFSGNMNIEEKMHEIY